MNNADLCNMCSLQDTKPSLCGTCCAQYAGNNTIYSILNLNAFKRKNNPNTAMTQMLNCLKQDEKLTDKEKIRTFMLIATELNTKLEDMQKSLYSCRSKWDNLRDLFRFNPKNTKVKKLILEKKIKKLILENCEDTNYDQGGW